MCDYSLSACKSRDAAVDDRLISGPIGYKTDSYFSWLDPVNVHTTTRGFHDGDDTVAVCLRPGTELAFEDGRVGRFREINEDDKYRHHDAVEFEDGKVVLVHDLPVGTRCRVLQLPATVKRFHAECRPAERVEPVA